MTIDAMFAPYKSRVVSRGGSLRPLIYLPGTSVEKKLRFTAVRIIRCKNMALYIRDCVYLCLSDETLKAVGPLYLVSMPGE